MFCTYFVRNVLRLVFNKLLLRSLLIIFEIFRLEPFFVLGSSFFSSSIEVTMEARGWIDLCQLVKKDSGRREVALLFHTRSN